MKSARRKGSIDHFPITAVELAHVSPKMHDSGSIHLDSTGNILKSNRILLSLNVSIYSTLEIILYAHFKLKRESTIPAKMSLQAGVSTLVL